MEKLNILDILKDKPIETKLWSDTFGKVFLFEKGSDCFDVRVECNDTTWRFRHDGAFANFKGTLCVYPSNEMRDWEKFAWKKGDVLRFSDILVIFEKWIKDDYTEFKASYEFNSYSNSFDKGNNYYTSEFCKAIDDVADNFIKKVEEHYGGKLNLSTLQIEQPKPEFKDGDIVRLDNSASVILKEIEGNRIYYHFYIQNNGSASFNTWINIGTRTIRLATDPEKQQLLSALDKEGKAWNPDTKQIVDLPKKCEFKPFDKVLVRITNIDVWNLNLFSYDKGVNSPYRYICVSGSYFQCIPYNDSTKHLLGTTDEWKGR